MRGDRLLDPPRVRDGLRPRQASLRFSAGVRENDRKSRLVDASRYHERGAVAGCVRLRSSHPGLSAPSGWLLCPLSGSAAKAPASQCVHVVAALGPSWRWLLLGGGGRFENDCRSQ
jgi:hypothetical protein